MSIRPYDFGRVKTIDRNSDKLFSVGDELEVSEAEEFRPINLAGNSRDSTVLKNGFRGNVVKVGEVCLSRRFVNIYLLVAYVEFRELP